MPSYAGAVYDPADDDPDRAGDAVDPAEQAPVDWDAWARGRGMGRLGRWRLIIALATMAAVTLLYLKSGGTAIPWMPASR